MAKQDADIKEFYDNIYKIVFKAVKDAISSSNKVNKVNEREKVAEAQLRSLFNKELIGDYYNDVIGRSNNIDYLSNEQLNELNKIGGING